MLGIEKGTIHTKRHSGEDPSKNSIAKSESGCNVFSEFNISRTEKQRNQDEMSNSLEEVCKIFSIVFMNVIVIIIVGGS